MNMKILKSSFDDSLPDPIASFGDWDAFSDSKLPFLKGAPLGPVTLRPIVIKVEDNHPEQAPPGLIDYFRANTFHIASAKLKSSLEAFSKDVEFVPVTLHYHGKLIEHKYFILHPLRRIEGLDRKQSVFEEDEGFIISISKTVIDESKFEGIDCAYFAEGSVVLLSDAVQRAMKASGCVGFQFTEISEFNC
jgi:hypothetical protein